MNGAGSGFIREVDTYPSVSIPARHGGLPVEVTLIAQLGHGAGSRLAGDAGARQRHHPGFVDALDEPSTKIGSVDMLRGDATSLYSFVVGAAGHPFHRHAGHRVFTAVSGSAGAQLRFSTASLDDIASAPASFPASLHLVDVPPDCMFTVRFGGGTWHQFVPLVSGSRQPALFAVSCHTDELGGLHAPALRAQVMAGQASIPALTEVLPLQARDAIDAALSSGTGLRRTALSLQAPSTHWQARCCQVVRTAIARVRRMVGGASAAPGFATIDVPATGFDFLDAPPADALVHVHFAPSRIDHDDGLRLVLTDDALRGRSAVDLLDDLLEAFVTHPPKGVTGLMMLRNVLVRPLGLRRSHLGCPVSSLAGTGGGTLFAGRHRVLAERVDGDLRRAQVMLGADDLHLRFRTCVGVEVLGQGRVAFWMSNRVACRNTFGHLYMGVIRHVHRQHVSPALLRSAVGQLLSPAVVGMPVTRGALSKTLAG